MVMHDTFMEQLHRSLPVQGWQRLVCTAWQLQLIAARAHS
jgi:hypothetical protein